ncbi:MAG: glycosyltransferase [Gemmatimonadaceae bacterium]
MTTVSVIVPTRDRPAALERCLAAVGSQRGLDSLEIVVVDDGSMDAERISAIVSSQPGALLIRRVGAGPAAARNAGATAATGTVLCFTDDDCEPAPDWAALLVRRLEASADAAGGATVSGEATDPFSEATELIVRELQASTHRRLSNRVFIPLNNLACRRSVALEYPFDESYTRAGGEDRAWCARIAAAGLTLGLEPNAIISHRPVLGFGGFWRQHERYGRGAFRFVRSRTSGDWQEPPGFYFGLLRASIRTSLTCLSLVLLAQVATTVGFVKEAVERKSHR